jgi:hypothetical protein
MAVGLEEAQQKKPLSVASRKRPFLTGVFVVCLAFLPSGLLTQLAQGAERTFTLNGRQYALDFPAEFGFFRRSSEERVSFQSPDALLQFAEMPMGLSEYAAFVKTNVQERDTSDPIERRQTYVYPGVLLNKTIYEHDGIRYGGFGLAVESRCGAPCTLVAVTFTASDVDESLGDLLDSLARQFADRQFLASN